jgi:hypothetical protein
MHHAHTLHHPRITHTHAHTTHHARITRTPRITQAHTHNTCMRCHTHRHAHTRAHTHMLPCTRPDSCAHTRTHASRTYLVWMCMCVSRVRLLPARCLKHQRMKLCALYCLYGCCKCSASIVVKMLLCKIISGLHVCTQTWRHVRQGTQECARTHYAHACTHAEAAAHACSRYV